jgi:hypothetical protein
MRFMLEHVGGDKFIYKDAPELPDYPAVVKFTVGPSDVATALNQLGVRGHRAGHPHADLTPSRRSRRLRRGGPWLLHCLLIGAD